MYKFPCYRIEVERDGKVVKKTIAYSEVNEIKDKLNGEVGRDSIVKVYREYGKKPIFEVRG